MLSHKFQLLEIPRLKFDANILALTTGIIVLTKFNLCYITMPLKKFKLFWLISISEDFYDFTIYSLYSYVKTWPSVMAFLMIYSIYFHVRSTVKAYYKNISGFKGS